MNELVHRAIDIVISALALVACAPLHLLQSAAVWLGMGRPALFVQAGWGRHGAPFALVKFRSITDALDRNGVLLPDRERTTPLGRLLRRSRLDQLPAFWKILFGQMSLISPRPILPETIQEMAWTTHVAAKCGRA